MKGRDVMRAMGDIDDRFLDTAEKHGRARPAFEWKNLVALAASAVLVVGAVTVALSLGGGSYINSQNDNVDISKLYTNNAGNQSKGEGTVGGNNSPEPGSTDELGVETNKVEDPKPVKEDTFTYFSESVPENGTPDGEFGFVIDEKGAELVRKIIEGQREWRDDALVNRGPFFWDAAFRLGDTGEIYFFSFYQNVIYSDGRFASLTDEEVRALNMLTGKEILHLALNTENPPADDEFVSAVVWAPGVVLDIKYASEDNFTGQRIYDFYGAYLRFGTVKKLAKAALMLRSEGKYLKIWDAYRPVSAQWKLWEVCPDPVYVANPEKGYSSHSRGNTVDVTLVDAEGNEVAMPTGFDDFTELADRDYSDVEDRDAVRNAELLEKVMTGCGFRPYSGEWWHFTDEDSYEIPDFNP